MKLFLDQNLSYKLIERLQDIFPGSSHVKFNNLMKATDLEIREFAKENNFTIVTQDSDFYDLSMIKGTPPKIIWIRAGNTSTMYVENLLRNNVIAIRHFDENEDNVCLELL